jgi:hypothetical protein
MEFNILNLDCFRRLASSYEHTTQARMRMSERERASVAQRKQAPRPVASNNTLSFKPSFNSGMPAAVLQRMSERRPTIPGVAAHTREERAHFY